MVVADVENDGWLTVKQLAKQLRCDVTWVIPRVADGAFASEERAFNDQIYTYYEPLCLVQLRRERERLMRLPLLGDYLTMPQLARLLICSRQVVERLIRELGLVPRYRRDAINRRVACYGPKAVRRLQREYRRRYPVLADDYLTVGTLVHLSGYRATTVVNRLKQAGLMPERRFLQHDGRMHDMFAPEAVAILGVKRQYRAGGTWMTEAGLARYAGMTSGRVRTWLKYHPQPWEWRLDDCSIPRRHYSPAVGHALRRDMARALQEAS